MKERINQKEFITVFDTLPRGGAFASVASGEHSGTKVFMPSKVSKDVEVAQTYLATLVWNDPRQQEDCPYMAIKIKKLDSKLIELSTGQLANFEKLIHDLIERVKSGMTTLHDGEIIEILMRENNQ